jgi:hypothetical protein
MGLLPPLRVALLVLMVLGALLPDSVLARKGKKGKRGAKKQAQQEDGVEQDLEKWKAAADAEGAPRVTLLPRDTGMEPMATRMTKRDFNPAYGTIYTATGDRITEHEQIQDGAALIAVPSARQLGRNNPGRFFTWPVYPVPWPRCDLAQLSSQLAASVPHTRPVWWCYRLEQDSLSKVLNALRARGQTAKLSFRRWSSRCYTQTRRSSGEIERLLYH